MLRYASSRFGFRALGASVSAVGFSHFTATRAFASSQTQRTAKVVVVGHENSNGDEEFEHLNKSAQIVSYLQDASGLDKIDTSADILFVSEICTPVLMKELVSRMPNLKWVHSRWAGLNHFLCPELINSDIPVTNAKGAYSHSLAEFALFGCLYFEKLAPRMLAQKEKHHWEKFVVGMIDGKTLGVIGYGDIGQYCAKMCKAAGMRVIALRRRPGLTDDDICDKCYGPDEINTLMAESDYVLVATALTPGTFQIVGKEELAACQPHCVILNVGRGPCIDESALVDALQSGTIRGACLDVFDKEPLPESSPLWDLDNVFLSPHTADMTPSYFREGVKKFNINMDKWINDEPLENICDKAAGY